MILNKKIVLSYLILSLLVIAMVLGIIVYFWFFKKPAESPQISGEKTMEEILQSLTASATGEKTEVSKKVLESLSAPKEKSPTVAEDILKSLTAPSSR